MGNHVRDYIVALTQWQKDGMPSSGEDHLEGLWTLLTKPERAMAAAIIGMELRSHEEPDESA